MERKYDKTSEQWKFFMDYWSFVQKYAIPENDDDFWEEVTSSSDDLCKKYGNKQYFRDLVLAHVEELERKCKH